jgi:hypothetical protein
VGKDATRPPEDARDAIEKAASFCLSRTAEELSLLTHERSRSWIEGQDGEVLDIYIDLIPDEDLEHGLEEIHRLDKELARVLEERT